jgi:hypothetical protein
MERFALPHKDNIQDPLFPGPVLRQPAPGLQELADNFTRTQIPFKTLLCGRTKRAIHCTANLIYYETGEVRSRSCDRLSAYKETLPFDLLTHEPHRSQAEKSRSYPAKKPAIFLQYSPGIEHSLFFYNAS